MKSCKCGCERASHNIDYIPWYGEFPKLLLKECSYLDGTDMIIIHNNSVESKVFYSLYDMIQYIIEFKPSHLTNAYIVNSCIYNCDLKYNNNTISFNVHAKDMYMDMIEHIVLFYYDTSEFEIGGKRTLQLPDALEFIPFRPPFVLINPLVKSANKERT